MNSSNNNKTTSNNTNDSIKKSSLPLIVSTSALLFAGVISCDINSTAQLSTALSSSVAVCSQSVITSQTATDEGSTDDTKKKSNNKIKSYFTNSNGEVLYDSDAEDDAYYYQNWDTNDIDTDDVFIFW